MANIGVKNGVIVEIEDGARSRQREACVCPARKVYVFGKKREERHEKEGFGG